MNVTRIASALVLLSLAASTAVAVVTQTPYQINGGGQYTYKPSPEGPGIPGGMPSDFQLDFGIGGSFVYELDTAGPTARLLNLNLVLTGNEAIQANPPVFGLVTADRVENFLANQTFVNDVIGGLLHLKSSMFEALKLTDSLSGSILIRGGYDATPVDGDGAQFQLSAVAVPEPASLSLFPAAAIAIALVARRRAVRLTR